MLLLFQTQEIGSSTHFLGQSEMAAHFGLGRDGANVTVHVEWPADNKQMTYRDVPPNTRLRVVRPADGSVFSEVIAPVSPGFTFHYLRAWNRLAKYDH